MLKKRGSISLILAVISALFFFTGTADAAGGCKDRDNDGYFNKAGCGTAVDCDDSDATVNPGAVEECTDGIDNDCDGLIDMQDPDAVNCPVCNNDSDGDGYYTDGGACGPVDCNDADPAINPGAVEICDDPGLVDEDCDGLANGDDPDCSGTACSSYTARGDCNGDLNCEWIGGKNNGYCQDVVQCTITEDPEVTCNDGIDNDCDGATDTADTDCQTGGQQDCSLLSSKNSCNAAVNCKWNKQQGICEYNCTVTETPEISCSDGFDNDCDGAYDLADSDCGSGDTIPPASTIMIPSDATILNSSAPDPYTVSGNATDNAEVTDIEISVNGGAWQPAVCTGCPGTNVTWTYSWPLPADGPYTVQSRATDSSVNVETPSAGNSGLIDRTAPSVSVTIPADGATGVTLDSNVTVNWTENVDCSTVTTTNISSDSPGWMLWTCSASQAVFTTNGQSGSSVYNVNVTTAVTDAGGNPMAASYPFSYTTTGASCTDNDGDGYGDGAGCLGPDCDDSNPSINPGADDSNCNGIDENCDTVADDGYVITPTTCGLGECAGNTGQLECQGGTLVNTCDPFAGAAPDDSVCNGLDDDCDSLVDEDYVTSTTQCGVGVCSSSGLLECLAGVEIDSCTPGSPTEVPEATCNDGLDNDCDGLTDDPEDPDCTSAVQSCVDCHNSQQNQIYNTRQIAGAGGDFVRPSHHVNDGTTNEIVTPFDCAICHAEGDVTKINSGTGYTSDTLHNDGSTPTTRFVNMRNVDDLTMSWQWNKYAPTSQMRDDMDSFCMGCHDSDGASDVAVNNFNDGLIVDAANTLTTVRAVTGPNNANANNVTVNLRPYNTDDTLVGNTTDFADLFLSGFKTGDAAATYGRVVNVKDQFNSANQTGSGWASHHNLNQFTKRYTTRDTSAFPNEIFTAVSLKDGGNLQTLGETAGLHCADCHLNEANAHGAANSRYMLQDKDGNDTNWNGLSLDNGGTHICYKCHAGAAYTNTSSDLGRFDHNKDESRTLTTIMSPMGIVCFNCHGGYSSRPEGALGAIHGTNEDYVPGGSTATTKRFRFMSGSAMRFYRPATQGTGDITDADWESASTQNSCYTIGALDSWATACTQHSSGVSMDPDNINYQKSLQW